MTGFDLSDTPSTSNSVLPLEKPSGALQKTGWRDSYRCTQDSTLQLTNALHERLMSLNGLAIRRASIVPGSDTKVETGTPDERKSFDNSEWMIGESSNDSSEEEKSQQPCSLSYRNPNITETEASKRLEAAFDKFHMESNAKKERASKSKGGLSRIEAKRKESRKKRIQLLQSQLEKNSSRYLARAANSIRFKKKINGDFSDSSAGAFSQTKLATDNDYITYPIPLGGCEMNPDLFLSLSCEKISLDRGRQMMKSVALHKISLKLFVLMYWYVHCRFFQKCSVSEQRYLLERVASIFPEFISMMSSMTNNKMRDILFMRYPFVLSKAIFLGFKYLCPGNHSLFQGAFERILNLSVFRLLSGIDICANSVDALRLKLYADDIMKEEEDVIETESDNQLRPLPSEPNMSTQGKYNAMRSNQMRPNLFKGQSRRRCAMIDPTSLPGPSSNKARNSVLKYMGERDSLRFRPEKPVALGGKVLPRQQQISFDSQQISPLLQQCLGREGITLRKKQILKRTEPVRYCKTGGVETFKSRAEELDECNNYWDSMLQQHKTAIREEKSDAAASEAEHRKYLEELNREERNAMDGGKLKQMNFLP